MNRKSLIIKCSTTAITLAFLTGCGGGGGGGGPGSSIRADTYTRVPYATPRLVGIVDPLEKVTERFYIYDTYVTDLTGDGGQDVIFAGRMTQQADGGTDWQVSREEWSNSQLHMFSWDKGQLVNKTAQWFPNRSNVILGTEPSIHFANFDNAGQLDMLVAPSTDSEYYGPAYVFFNEGNQFSRLEVPLNDVWAHDSAVADFNNDGYPDFILTDYGPNTTVAINDQNRNFTTYVQHPDRASLVGGASIAAADFMGTGQASVIVSDHRSNNDTVLFEVDLAGQFVEFTQISVLPASRFGLPKYAGYSFNKDASPGHNVRIAAHDFNDNGRMDAIVFSMPDTVILSESRMSEIQFLANQGGGNFIDVTDDVLVGYDNNTVITYNPKFVDLNNDGLTDILVSGQDFDTTATSHQFLLKSSDGKYVAAYQNVLTDFITQTVEIENARSGSAVSGGQLVNLVRDPDGKLYLITGVNFTSGGDMKQAVYLSEIRNDGTVYTPQLSVDLLKSAWPYLTDGDANEVLASSGKSYLGATMIDLDQAFRPVGELGLALNGRLGAVTPLRGYIAGINLGNFDGVISVVDQTRRDFQVDVSPTAVTGSNHWTRTMNVPTNHVNAMPSQAQNLVSANLTDVEGYRMAQGPDDLNLFTIGAPAVKINDQWSFHTQLTGLNFSPWLQMDGIWGRVKNTLLTEFVFSYQKDLFVMNTGLMYAKTNIDPGLVTSVDDIWSAWAEVGLRDRDLGLGAFVGMKPWVLSGAVNTNLPTGVDIQGNMQYTEKSFAIQNSFEPYVRVAYTANLSKKITGSIGAIMFQNGQHGITGSINYRF